MTDSSGFAICPQGCEHASCKLAEKLFGPPSPFPEAMPHSQRVRDMYGVTPPPGLVQAVNDAVRTGNLFGRGEVRITDPKTGGQKGQKPERFDLLPFDALEEVARVYGIGAQKYEDDNWLKGYRWRLSAGALLRHVSRWMLGEDRDQTGCHHLAHAAWHCLTLLTFSMRGLGTDDRAKASQR